MFFVEEVGETNNKNKKMEFVHNSAIIDVFYGKTQ